jgi:transcriptional regulator with XRE-family HTH domain
MNIENIGKKEEIFKFLRKKNKFSQTEMAEKIGVSLNTLSNFENGKTDLPSESIKISAKIFNVTTDYLLNAETMGEINEEERMVIEAMRTDEDFKITVEKAARIKKKVLMMIENAARRGVMRTAHTPAHAPSHV